MAHSKDLARPGWENGVGSVDLCPTTHHLVGGCRTQRNTGLGNRVGRTASGDVFLASASRNHPPGNHLGKGVGTEAWVCVAIGTALVWLPIP